MAQYKLGLDCVLTIGGTQIKDAKDVTLNIERGDADVTTRNANGWRAHLGTLKDASIEFDILTGGADGTKLASLFNSGETVDLEISGGNVSFTAKVVVTNFAGSQPLEDAESVSVTLRPAPVTSSSDAPELDVNGGSGS